MSRFKALNKVTVGYKKSIWKTNYITTGEMLLLLNNNVNKKVDREIQRKMRMEVCSCMWGDYKYFRVNTNKPCVFVYYFCFLPKHGLLFEKRLNWYWWRFFLKNIESRAKTTEKARGKENLTYIICYMYLLIWTTYVGQRQRDE